MKLRIFICLFPGVLFFCCGMRSADCGLPKSEVQDPKDRISRDAAIKLFTDANEEYLQATKFIASKKTQEADQHLKEAVLQYETILAGGFKNGQIYYNLGNTYYRQGELGKAIVNYQRAKRFMPRNADLDANLRLVKRSTEDREFTTEIPVVIRRIFFWYILLNQDELFIVAVSLYVVVMILFFFSIIRKYAWFKKATIGFSVVLFVIMISLGSKIYREQGVDRGVIIETKCEVRYGPGEEYEPKFEIHNGAECVIEDEKDDWYRVYVNVGIKQTPDSKEGAEEIVRNDVRRGWLQKKHVDVI
ncbi:MAG: tetratricopeptide repeat protein [Planctomycetia bacterium]|nr:tetratricopeptide repeat protein [Planctomycetia bacterium]